MIQRIRAFFIRLRDRIYFRIYGEPYNWPPARVITRAVEGLAVPPIGTSASWPFACGDCKIVWYAEVSLSDPESFHPQCPGCVKKLNAWLYDRGQP